MADKPPKKAAKPVPNAAREILRALTSQRFSDWYLAGNFDKYIRGTHDAPNQLEILDEIRLLFKVN